MKTTTRIIGWKQLRPLPVALAAVCLIQVILAGFTGIAQTYRIVRSFGDLENLAAQPAAPLVQGQDGTLYGTTTRSGGGERVDGTVFKIHPDGTGFAVLKCFRGTVDSTYEKGATPSGGLTISGETLYGMTQFGGVSNCGTVFRLNTDGSDFTELKHFLLDDGSSPSGELLLAGTTLYGMTSIGGDSSRGTAFRLNTDGSGFTVLKRFAGSDGRNPVGGLVLSDGMLYGATSAGGSSNMGTVFMLSTNGDEFRVITHFTNRDIGQPSSGLVASGGTLYGIARGVFRLNTDGTGFMDMKIAGDNRLMLSGTTLYWTKRSGGASYCGTVLKMGTNGSGFAKLYEFSDTGEGRWPEGGVMLSGTTLYGTTANGAGGGGGAVFKINADGTDFGVIKRFGRGSDGRRPGSLVLSDSTLYGTTDAGGTNDLGTVFRMSASGGDYVLLKQFVWLEPTPYGKINDGHAPRGLVLSGTTLYGTTYSGGYHPFDPIFELSRDWGTLFRLNTDGSGFWWDYISMVTGTHPVGGLVLVDTTLYGATEDGAIFKCNTTNASGFTRLKYLVGSDGIAPGAGLILSGTTQYGTTQYGGTFDCGTVYKIGTDGSGFMVLKHFTGDDGRWARAELTLSGQTLYGTTAYGGSSDCGTLFMLGTDGSGFTVLRHFSGGDGRNPATPLTVSGATLYGATERGGDFDNGTVFQVNADGTGFIVLKHFSGPEGGRPTGPLVLSGRTLYGTASIGGDAFEGVVFSLSLAPHLVNPVCVGTNFTFSFQSDAGENYTVEYSDDLSAANWLFHHNVTGDGGLISCRIPRTNNAPSFFRLRLP
ncbi:MAG: hypothetical protein IH623_06300 [Verrucomicrobia bacterium]|nr:hypothetical protein [Verrucomicrobiota bacterium]